jgi:hypothetical protein
MGSANGRRDPGARERRPRHGGEERDRLTRAKHGAKNVDPMHAKHGAKNVDPIFSTPYKPASASPAAARAAAPQRGRQVAALLVGLPKSK